MTPRLPTPHEIEHLGDHRILQAYDVKGEVIRIDTRGPRLSLATANLTATVPDNFEQVRRDLLRFSKAADANSAGTAKRLLERLDILTETNPAVRHQKIRRLPVSIVVSAGARGEAGIAKSFVVRGKTRVRLMVPASVQTHSQSPELTGDSDIRPPDSGPSAALDSPTGRWKSDGQGGCYWDAYDDGPDQCSPYNGRWKSDGQGGCYWLDNDEGPNQCEPPPSSETCYYEGEPSPCATQQEIDDLLILAADSLAEADYLQSEYDSNYAEYEAYCTQNPWDCEEDFGEAIPLSGPNACSAEGCGYKAAAAAGSILAFAGTSIHAIGAAGVTGAAAMTTAAAIGWGALILGTGIVAGAATLAFVECKLAKVQSGSTIGMLPPFEPVY